MIYRIYMEDWSGFEYEEDHEDKDEAIEEAKKALDTETYPRVLVVEINPEDELDQKIVWDSRDNMFENIEEDFDDMENIDMNYNDKINVGDRVTIQGLGEESPWEGLNGEVIWIDEDDFGDDFQTITVRVNFPTEEGTREVNQNFDKRNIVKNAPAVEEALNNKPKVGDKIRIIHLTDEDNSYDGKEGEITHIDDIGQLHGTWGGLAIIPETDEFEIICADGKCEELEEKCELKEETNMEKIMRVFDEIENTPTEENLEEKVVSRKFKKQWIEDKDGNIVEVRYNDKSIKLGDKVGEDDYVTGFDPETNTVFLDEDPNTDGGRDYSVEDVFGESLEESKSNISFWAADKDNFDDGELFKTEEKAIEHANSNNRWIKVYKGDFTKLMTPEWKPEIVWTKSLKEAKEGESAIFGYINGDLKDFNPREFVEKVQNRKTSLHTNRMVKETDNVKICHHIVCETLGWGENPKIFVDVVEEVWTRNSGYDADDYRSYQGETTQDRILMENCGKAPEGFEKAIEVLEKYKADTLAKNENLEESYKPTWNNLLKKLDELGIDWEYKNSSWNPEIEELIEIDGEDAFALCEDGICYGEELNYWEGRFNIMKALTALYKEAPERYPSLKKLVDLEESLNEPLEEASSAETKAFKNGGKDLDDLIQGKSIARIKDPAARQAAVAAVKAGRPEVAKQFIGDRKDNQALNNFERKAKSMAKAGVKDEELNEASSQEYVNKYSKELEQLYNIYVNENKRRVNSDIIRNNLNNSLNELSSVELVGLINNYFQNKEDPSEQLKATLAKNDAFSIGLSNAGWLILCIKQGNCKFQVMENIFIDGRNNEGSKYIPFDTLEEALQYMKEACKKVKQETPDATGYWSLQVEIPGSSSYYSIAQLSYKKGSSGLAVWTLGKGNTGNYRIWKYISPEHPNISKEFKDELGLTFTHNPDNSWGDLEEEALMEKRLTWDDIEIALYSNEYHGPVHSEYNYGGLCGFESRKDAAEAADFIEKKFGVRTEVERVFNADDDWIIRVPDAVLENLEEDMEEEKKIETIELPHEEYTEVEDIRRINNELSEKANEGKVFGIRKEDDMLLLAEPEINGIWAIYLNEEGFITKIVLF